MRFDIPFRPLVMLTITMMYLCFLVLCVLSKLRITSIGDACWIENFKSYLSLMKQAMNGEVLDT